MNSYDSRNVVLGGSGIRVERVLEMEAPIESSYIHITKVFFSPQGFGKSKTIRGNSTLLSTLVEYCPEQYSWTSKKISEAFAIFTMTANSGFEEMWPVWQYASFILSNNYLVVYNKRTGWCPSALVRQLY